MELCTSKQERLIRVLVEFKSVNQSESCLLKPRELEIGPYKIQGLSHKISLQSALGLCFPFCQMQPEQTNFNAHQFIQCPKMSYTMNVEEMLTQQMYLKTRPKTPEKTQKGRQCAVLTYMKSHNFQVADRPKRNYQLSQQLTCKCQKFY